MELNGIAHVQLTVNNFSECRSFYKELLTFLEMKIVFDEDDTFYCVGGRTGIVITPSADKHKHETFVDSRVGLHHLCFRLRSREDVDRLYAFVCDLRAEIVYPPKDGPWAAGYYSFSFRDPTGIRLEANFVPGKGNLAPDVTLPRALPKS